MRALAEYEAGFQLGMFNAAIPAQVTARLAIVGVSAEQAYSAALARPFQGRLLSEWSASLEADRAARIRDAIRIGYVENQTAAQMVQRVRGTRARGYKDGVIEIDRRNAEAVVRTAVSHTAGVVRDRFYEANDDLIKAVVWTSTLDSRTTHTCFPGSTPVLPIGALQGVSKRPFEGHIFVITTASGKQLSATGNHPILTARGWRPAKEIEPGKDVLCRLVGDVAGLEADKDVGVQTTLGALADALDKPAFAQVLAHSSSEAEFHGDGSPGHYKVYVPSALGGYLGAELNACGRKDVGESLLTGIQLGRLLSSIGGERALLKRFCDTSFGGMASEADATSAQPSVERAACDVEGAHDFDGAHSGSECGDDLGFIGAFSDLATPQCQHNALVFQEARDGGRCDPKVAGDACGRQPVCIVADNVVSVVSEFFAGHVFNLQTSSELYIAGGFVVHNCRLRDGKQYTNTGHRPIGHSYPWLGGPGRAHWRCRSVGVPVTKSFRDLGIDIDELSPGTRASMDGQVPADTTYGQWLKRQSAARQDDVLGPTRGALFRRGGLTIDKFADERGRELTLAELRERDAEAFSRAGL